MNSQLQMIRDDRRIFENGTQIEYLVEVVQQLSLARNLPTIMEIVSWAARRLTNSDGSTFILRDGENCYYADENAIAPLWKGSRFPLEICIGGWTMNNRTNAVIVDVAGDARIPYEAYQPTFVKSLVTAPIRIREPIGAIGTYWAQQHHPTLEEIKLLQALADSTAIAMENVQLYLELEQRVKDRTLELEIANQHLKDEITQRQKAEAEVRQLSLTDELTQLYNRRGFIWLGEREIENAYRRGQYCALFFLDLDGLKPINDNYGHEMGDRMIVATANILKQSFRVVDLIARLGGDEFVVLLTVEDLAHLEIIEQRLQDNLHEFNQSSHQVYQLSFSIGKVVSQRLQNPNALKTMLTQADTQMYLQKKEKKRYTL
jgi:diguanylate cyclase (GGDEF)-like protein